jgi:hypothetical protein
MVPRKFEATPKMNRKVEVALAPPEMQKKAWQPKVNIPKPTPTLPKKTKMVWRKKVLVPQAESTSSKTK